MVDGPLLRAVNEALRSANPRAQDAGTVALIRRYANLIDEAAPKSTYRQWIRQIAAGLDGDNEAAVEAFRKVQDALAAHSVASDLGPKLLAALTSLGLAGQGAKGVQPHGGIVGKLDEFTARRTGQHRS